jgi:hypothetical protein
VPQPLHQIAAHRSPSAVPKENIKCGLELRALGLEPINALLELVA